MKIKDETGKHYGRLEVLEFSHSDNGAVWKCRCKCGSITEVRAGNLRNNSTKSCGCENKGYRKGILGRQRYHVIDDKFFAKDTKLSNYWAGFIAADGNIHSKKPCLIIGLAIKDRLHLERFKLDTKCSYDVKTGKNKQGYGYCSLYITSPKMVDALKTRFLITPRKSLTLRYPEFTSTIKEDCYIIGYIDGDGHINQFGKRRIEIVGTKWILEGIRNRFKLLTDNKINKVQKVKSKKVFKLILYGENVSQIVNHLNKISGLTKLDRKWVGLKCA